MRISMTFARVVDPPKLSWSIFLTSSTQNPAQAQPEETLQALTGSRHRAFRNRLLNRTPEPW